jgi:hypothetical protein
MRKYLTILALLSACGSDPQPGAKLAAVAAGADAGATGQDPAIATLQADLAALQGQVAGLADQLAALPAPATPTPAPDLSGYATKADLAALADKVSKQIAGLPTGNQPPDLSGYAKSADLAGFAKSADVQALADTIAALTKQVADLPKGNGNPQDLSGYAKLTDLAPLATKKEVADLIKPSAQVLTYTKNSSVAQFNTVGSSQVLLHNVANLNPTIDGVSYPVPDAMSYVPILLNLAPGKHFYDHGDKCSAASCSVLLLDMP